MQPIGYEIYLEPNPNPKRLGEIGPAVLSLSPKQTSRVRTPQKQANRASSRYSTVSPPHNHNAEMQIQPTLTLIARLSLTRDLTLALSLTREL